MPSPFVSQVPNPNPLFASVKTATSETLFERTDLGDSAVDVFRDWMNGDLSGRFVAIWVADNLEKSARMRLSNPNSVPQTPLSLLTADVESVVNRAHELYEEIFSRPVEDLLNSAAATLGGLDVLSKSDASVLRINTVFRRLSLQSRWASAIIDPLPSTSSVSLPTLHIYLTLLRAHYSPPPPSILSPFPTYHQPSQESLLLSELTLTDSEVFLQSSKMSESHLSALNQMMEDYILLQMRLKSRAIDLLANRSEDGLYSVLGLSPSATNAEIKKAYRHLAMQLHPDKGGDKELFQKLNEAYEKIMQLRSGGGNGQEDEEEVVVEEQGVGVDQNFEPENAEQIPTAKESGDNTSLLARLRSLVKESARNATLACELVGKSDNFSVIVKYSRICAYSALDAASLSLEMLASPDYATLVDVVTKLSSELMSAGFDTLNAATNSSGDSGLDLCCDSARRTSSLAAQLLDTISNPPTGDNVKENGKKSVEEGVREESVKGMLQRKQNAELLRKFNSDIADTFSAIRDTLTDDEYDVVNLRRMKTVLVDVFSVAIDVTAKRVEGNILIRSVEQIFSCYSSVVRVDIGCVVQLPVAPTAIGGVMRYTAMVANDWFMALIESHVVKPLVDITQARNKTVPRDELREGIEGRLRLHEWRGLKIAKLGVPKPRRQRLSIA